LNVFGWRKQMITIAKESLAPIHFESLRRAHRANATGLVPEVVYSLFLCHGIRKSMRIEEIAAQATLTYPGDFYTWVSGEPVPDLALILLTLHEASSEEWHYVIGDWSRGWHLTKQGIRFAKDVERRRLRNGRARVRRPQRISL
jgi:hypothetical protein